MTAQHSNMYSARAEQPAGRPQEQIASSSSKKSLSARFASKMRKSLVPKFLRRTRDSTCALPAADMAPSAPVLSEEQLLQDSANAQSLALRKKAMDWMLLASQSCSLENDIFMRATSLFDQIRGLVEQGVSAYVVAGAALSLVVQECAGNDREEDRLFRTPDSSPEEVISVMNTASKLLDVPSEVSRDTAFDYIEDMAKEAGLKKPTQEFIIFAQYTCELYALALPVAEVDASVLAAAAVSYNMGKMRMKASKKSAIFSGPAFDALISKLAQQCSTIKSKPLHSKYSKVLSQLQKKRQTKGQKEEDHKEAAVLWSMAGLVAVLDVLFSV